MHFLLFPIQNISSNPRVYYKTRTRNSYSKTKLFKVNSLILPAMRFRQLQKVWPRRPLERLIVSAFLGLFPVGYYILIAKVLPELLDYGTAGYIFLWLLGLFLFTNLMSNYVMCMLADPSIDPRTMRRLLERGRNHKDWNECDKCGIWAPPRSRHCKVCGICVLKRDHHCIITGCCIGHGNYRYFIYFLIYTVISTLISFVASLVFIHLLRGGSYKFVFLPTVAIMQLENFNGLGRLNLWEVLATIIPGTFEIVFGVLFALVTVILCCSIYFLYELWPVFKSGATCYEFKSNDFTFDRGLRMNLEMIFGRRMNWTWISPFIPSQLPNDGIHWLPRDEDSGDWN